MTTQDLVLKTFIVYIFVKMLIFAPLAWMAFLSWWSERNDVQNVSTADAA
jgi:hypothetical protein